MRPKRYVICYWWKSTSSPNGDTEHIWAYTAADAVFQFNLNHRLIKSTGERGGESLDTKVIGVEPYQESRHGQWRIWS